ncbi:hypothetical protein [Paraburkholderia graminis]|uniref:Lipoprotein n=1 Tax=Paraburkholderia graminis TaxID=60548 RepID=A0ABD5CRS7_9BURK|nr:hypothetical protein [Paraburkholderia graminis]MDR6207972.1 hypothetical protein [Paraburkholderia graminis]
MKKVWASVTGLLVITLVGCSTQGSTAAYRDIEIALGNARESARVDCPTQADCERFWQRTEIYVTQRSATPIRRSDDSKIETAEPHTFGAVYVWATRTTGGGVSTIQIRAMCRGMYRADGAPGLLYRTCAEQIRAVETDFRAFIGASS